MAFPETIVSALLKPVFDRLTTALTSEYQLRRDVLKEVNKLNLTLSIIRSVLEDAEEKQINDKAVREWLRALKLVVLEADDVLDDYATRVSLKTRGEVGSGPSNNRNIVSIKRKVRKILTCSNLLPDISSGDIAHNIKHIREKLDDIAKNRSSLGLQVVSSGTRRFEFTTQRQTTSVLADESSVLGRDEEKQRIIQLLLSSSNKAESSSIQKNFSILSIVGMGGVGKTTLARLVFNDEKVKDYFPHLRMWVCISHDFDMARVTKEIIQSSSERNRDRSVSSNLDTLTNLDAIQQRLIEVVEGKRFLLVLDDVWNEDNGSKWHSLLEPLQFGGRGSMVIVTTRSRKVANIIPGRVDPIYELGALSADDLWKIFHKFAFGDNQTTHKQLETIGKKIAERLKGLPLAAKTVGCLLNSNLNVDHWRRILQSDILALDQGEDDILPSLKLSFNYLPGHVKQCFAYCSLFPKNHQFDKSQLIQLWMAQCMIQRERDLEIEDIGNYCFDDLLSRSFFQLSPCGDECYVMHDLIHDMAEYESKDDCFRMGDVSKEIPETVQHITLCSDNLEPSKVINLCRYEKLRTLLFLRGYKFDFSHVLDVLFTKLKRLRVLGLSCCEVKWLTESIGQLKHLRYLNLSRTPLEKLPNSLSSLHNLQVLNLQGCKFLSALPNGITKLINLRHLVAEESIISKIEGVGNLTSLQKLEYFDACKHKIKELQHMNQLRVLSIKHLEHVEWKEEASQVELKSKKRLKKLNLGWSHENRGDIISAENCKLNDEEVLEYLQPNADLFEDLTITGYAGTKFPSWLMLVSQSFLFLEKICLRDCRKVASLPPMGQLSFLKDLEISGMSGIKHVGNEFYGSRLMEAFPSLETFFIQGMSEWQVWKGAEEGQSFFPCLRKLHIHDCPKLNEFPPLPPSMTWLRMWNVGVTVLPGLQGTSSTTTSKVLSSSLSRLVISSCPNLTSLREGLLACQLEALQYLNIDFCEELVSLPIRGFRDLISLTELTIRKCPKLEPLITSDGALPSSLVDLKIFSCGDLGSSLLPCVQNCVALKTLNMSAQMLGGCMPVTEGGVLPSCLEHLMICGGDDTNIIIHNNSSNNSTFDEALSKCLQQLTSLTKLEICNCQSLTSLPREVLCHLAALKYLDISNCQQLTSLDLQSLSSLDILMIDGCPQIQSLPDIERLPASSMFQLKILGCPPFKGTVPRREA